MLKSPRCACGVARVLTGMALTALAGITSAAHAGQPYTCVCKGKEKRFIASTHMCEKDLHKASDRPVAKGFKLLVAPCTRAQFRAWTWRACRSNGCRPKF